MACEALSPPLVVHLGLRDVPHGREVPAHLKAATADAVRAFTLLRGEDAIAIVKSTEVMIARPSKALKRGRLRRPCVQRFRRPLHNLISKNRRFDQ
jgi:molybdopterin-binding protein